MSDRKEIRSYDLGSGAIGILDAEIARLHAQVERAEADYAMLRAVARKCFAEDGSEQSMLDLWNLAVAVEHPGAAMTIRFNRAKAVVECWLRQPHYYDDCDPGQNDPYYAWHAEMNSLVTAYYESLKARSV